LNLAHRSKKPGGFFSRKHSSAFQVYLPPSSIDFDGSLQPAIEGDCGGAVCIVDYDLSRWVKFDYFNHPQFYNGSIRRIVSANHRSTKTLLSKHLPHSNKTN
jgi:hypothetical protein|tara:strand:- start:1538 stop:1843 length:306 start_codon:yes stop_codon:yes gene_type:complete